MSGVIAEGLIAEGLGRGAQRNRKRSPDGSQLDPETRNQPRILTSLHPGYTCDSIHSKRRHWPADGASAGHLMQ
jgi:hypothetical protein